MRTNSDRNLIPVGALRNRKLGFSNSSYQFGKLSKYREAIPALDQRLYNVSPNAERVGSDVDSQYEMKSEANSGDDVFGNSAANQLGNLYKANHETIIVDKSHVRNGPDKAESLDRDDPEDLDEVELH